MKTNPVNLGLPRKFLIDVNIEIDIMYKNYFHWYQAGALSDFEKYVLLLEDRRYFFHRGFDVRSIARELIKKILCKKHGGASTIEMQFIRTLNNRRELTIRRKVRELILAYILRFHFNKVALLRSYLDVAFFGSGITGADAASEVMFQKRVESLVGYEAAFIAAMLVYPKPLAPTQNWFQKVERRANYALKLEPRFKDRFDKVPVTEI